MNRSRAAIDGFNFFPLQNTTFSAKRKQPLSVWIKDKVWNLRGIYGIASDNKGIIYCTASQILWRIHKNDIQPLLKIPSGQLEGIVWNGNNILFICDANHHSILEYAIDSNQASTLAGTGHEGCNDGNMKEATFCWPKGITLDMNGDLLGTDMNHVRKITLSTGTVQTLAGSSYGYADGPAQFAKFGRPSGICIDASSNIFVCDSLNNCIRSVKSDRVYTVAGIARNRGTKNSSLFSSKFEIPNDIVYSMDGTLLVCDKGFGLRIIDVAQGIVSSLKIDGIAKPTAVMMPNNDTLLIAVQEGIFKVGGVWSVERLLWIGHTKENLSYCLLPLLPRDIIREITAFVRVALWTVL